MNFVNGPGAVDIYGVVSAYTRRHSLHLTPLRTHIRTNLTARIHYNGTRLSPITIRITNRSTPVSRGICLSFKASRHSPGVDCDVHTGLIGGSLSGWGGPGYDGCFTLTGPDFQAVFYKNNWAANVKLISYYMLYGYVKSIQSIAIERRSTRLTAEPIGEVSLTLASQLGS